MKLTTNHAMSDEVSGITTNLTKGGTTMEPLLEDKQSLTPYQKLIRRSYGISKISNALNLRTLRNDTRALQAELNTQIETMNASLESIEDDLDRLAQIDEVKLVKEQIENLDSVLAKVNVQVAELLKA
jgi:hypothetical protein